MNPDFSKRTHLYDKNSETCGMNFRKLRNHTHEICQFQDARSIQISSIMIKILKKLYLSTRIKIKMRPICSGPQAESLIMPSRQFFHRFTLSRRNSFPITFTCKISQYKYLFQRSDMHHHYSFSLMKFEHKYCCKTHSQTWWTKKLVPHYVATVMDTVKTRV